LSSNLPTAERTSRLEQQQQDITFAGGQFVMVGRVGERTFAGIVTRQQMAEASGKLIETLGLVTRFGESRRILVEEKRCAMVQDHPTRERVGRMAPRQLAGHSGIGQATAVEVYEGCLPLAGVKVAGTAHAGSVSLLAKEQVQTKTSSHM